MSNWEISPDAVAPPEHIILLVLPEMSQIHQRFHTEFADVQKQGYAPLSEAHVERDHSNPDVLGCLLVHITQLQPGMVLKIQNIALTLHSKQLPYKMEYLIHLLLPCPERVLSLKGWFTALRVHQELVKQFMLKLIDIMTYIIYSCNLQAAQNIFPGPQSTSGTCQTIQAGDQRRFVYAPKLQKTASDFKSMKCLLLQNKKLNKTNIHPCNRNFTKQLQK